MNLSNFVVVGLDVDVVDVTPFGPPGKSFLPGERYVTLRGETEIRVQWPREVELPRPGTRFNVALTALP